MADLTDNQVVLDIQIAAKAAVWPGDEIETVSGLSCSQYDYEVKVLELMAAALAETPGDDQEAVYNAQAQKVAEALEFKQSAGAGVAGRLLPERMRGSGSLPAPHSSERNAASVG